MNDKNMNPKKFKEIYGYVFGVYYKSVASSRGILLVRAIMFWPTTRIFDGSPITSKELSFCLYCCIMFLQVHLRSVLGSGRDLLSWCHTLKDYYESFASIIKDLTGIVLCLLPYLYQDWDSVRWVWRFTLVCIIVQVFSVWHLVQ